MPLYEYQCKPNGHRFEVRHGMNEDPVATCPECGGQVRRVIHPVGIVFKGSGFYATDSRSSKTAVKPPEGGKAPGDAADGKSDTGKSDGAKADAAKPEGKKAESSGDAKAAG